MKQVSENEILQLFKPELRSRAKALEIYGSLCNNRWMREDETVSFSWRAAGGLIADLRNAMDLEVADPDICERCGRDIGEHIGEEVESPLSRLLRDRDLDQEIGPLHLLYYYCDEDRGKTFLPGYGGKEDYLDYYCSGTEGMVPDWIRERFAEAGYQGPF